MSSDSAVTAAAAVIVEAGEKLDGVFACDCSKEKSFEIEESLSSSPSSSSPPEKKLNLSCREPDDPDPDGTPSPPSSVTPPSEAHDSVIYPPVISCCASSESVVLTSSTTPSNHSSSSAGVLWPNSSDGGHINMDYYRKLGARPKRSALYQPFPQESKSFAKKNDDINRDFDGWTQELDSELMDSFSVSPPQSVTTESSQFNNAEKQEEEDWDRDSSPLFRSPAGSIRSIAINLYDSWNNGERLGSFQNNSWDRKKIDSTTNTESDAEKFGFQGGSTSTLAPGQGKPELFTGVLGAQKNLVADENLHDNLQRALMLSLQGAASSGAGAAASSAIFEDDSVSLEKAIRLSLQESVPGAVGAAPSPHISDSSAATASGTFGDNLRVFGANDLKIQCQYCGKECSVGFLDGHENLCERGFRRGDAGSIQSWNDQSTDSGADNRETANNANSAAAVDNSGPETETERQRQNDEFEEKYKGLLAEWRADKNPTPSSWTGQNVVSEVEEGSSVPTNTPETEDPDGAVGGQAMASEWELEQTQVPCEVCGTLVSLDLLEVHEANHILD